MKLQLFVTFSFGSHCWTCCRLVRRKKEGGEGCSSTSEKAIVSLPKTIFISDTCILLWVVKLLDLNFFCYFWVNRPLIFCKFRLSLAPSPTYYFSFYLYLTRKEREKTYPNKIKRDEICIITEEEKIGGKTFSWSNLNIHVNLENFTKF